MARPAISAPRRTKKKERLGRANWVNAALDAIAAGGTANVSVERIASELGATKGSFYWHFKDRWALIAASLLAWEQQHTDAIIERIQAVADPREQLKLLLRMAFDERPGSRIEAALLADADQPLIAQSLRRVTAKRLEFLESLFQQLTGHDARDRALLAYSAFIGIVQLRRTAPGNAPKGRRLQAYVDRVTRWLLDG